MSHLHEPPAPLRLPSYMHAPWLSCRIICRRIATRLILIPIAWSVITVRNSEKASVIPAEIYNGPKRDASVKRVRNYGRNPDRP